MPLFISIHHHHDDLASRMKHYRIQFSPLLALNNPKSIYTACPGNSVIAPAWLSKTSLLSHATDSWTQARPDGANTLPRVTAVLVRLLARSTAARDLHSRCHTWSKGSFPPWPSNISCNARESYVFTDEDDDRKTLVWLKTQRESERGG